MEFYHYERGHEDGGELAYRRISPAASTPAAVHFVSRGLKITAREQFLVLNAAEEDQSDRNRDDKFREGGAIPPTSDGRTC